MPGSYQYLISGTLVLWRPQISGNWMIHAQRVSTLTASWSPSTVDLKLRMSTMLDWPAGDISPSWLRKVWWGIGGNYETRERQWRQQDGKKKPSLAFAMNDAVKWSFWSGGLLKIIADMAQIASPLVIKAIIKYVSECYEIRKLHPTAPTPSVGRGVGLAIALFLLQIIASQGLQHAFHRSLGAGVLLRAGLITAIYRRSLRFTARARSLLPDGKIVNHISTAPIQMIVCLILLLLNLGVSASAGFAVFILITPAMAKVMGQLRKLRQKSMVWTDKRAKLLQELLGGMRIIKFFAWEIPFLKRIGEYRTKELQYIRMLLVVRSLNSSLAFSLPILSAVVAFIVYSVTGHNLKPDVIFASLALFQLLRLPLLLSPIALGAIADAANAIDRLTDVFTAELLGETHVIDPALPVAISLRNASFTWDGAPPPKSPVSRRNGKWARRNAKNGKKRRDSMQWETVDEGQVFKLKNLNLEIPRGQVCGFAFSNLLTGLHDDLYHRTYLFSDTSSYNLGSIWVMTMRDYGDALKATALLMTFRKGDGADTGKHRWAFFAYITFIHTFHNRKFLQPPVHIGDSTVWRMKGGNPLRWSAFALPRPFADVLVHDAFDSLFLPLGQPQRSISVPFYRKPSFALRVLEISEATLTGVASRKQNTDGVADFDSTPPTLAPKLLKIIGKYRIPRRKHHRMLSKRREGARHPLTYDKAIVPDTTANFSLLTYAWVLPMLNLDLELRMSTMLDWPQVISPSWLRKFGGQGEQEKQENGDVKETDAAGTTDKRLKTVNGTALMQAEDRVLGAVSSKGFYMGVYAGNGYCVSIGDGYLQLWSFTGLGIGQALSLFLLGSTFAVMSFFASVKMHKDSIQHMMHAPMSFFETTPLGRIMNRFSKDVDTLDNTLGDTLRIMTTTLSQIIGAIILISIILPWFLIPVGIVILVYFNIGVFYRNSARELKRLDSILRSSLYSHFSESLSGLGTIRAYGETTRFARENEKHMDNENRAYWLTITNQRWLGVHLDFLGAILTFAVAILAVASRFSISPSQTGVALSYILSVQQGFGWMIRQAAEVENNMNAVERVHHYAHNLEQEVPHRVDEKKPPPDWPSRGDLELNDISMSYRPGLPLVLKGLSLHVNGGEHIGVVGRTGAGKSSILVALYRLVELDSGSITLDGINVSTLGLADLRSKIAIIPQDPTLFSGTLRSNLDPFGVYDDARLWDALKRSALVDDVRKGDGQTQETIDGPSSPTSPSSYVPQSEVHYSHRFTLDSPVEDEGGNLSVGQRSLVSLARALVKDSQVVLLDEATGKSSPSSPLRHHLFVMRVDETDLRTFAENLKAVLACFLVRSLQSIPQLHVSDCNWVRGTIRTFNSVSLLPAKSLDSPRGDGLPVYGLTRPTGIGKSTIARAIAEWAGKRRMLSGRFFLRSDRAFATVHSPMSRSQMPDSYFHTFEHTPAIHFCFRSIETVLALRVWRFPSKARCVGALIGCPRGMGNREEDGRASLVSSYESWQASL
ncbi:hypothetical protein BS47DRAFT_1395826 [Hydnum rufescens UP504]|uniref:Uncharacterized protein n=1 Tax=Hydnum rufescens UP504 TaxID=1448309 RepID=A0A9P6ARI6_9AGAM|nr:hypothetical protein BS47DRAFT_1395826 [Hydnum rufescens UP504]